MKRPWMPRDPAAFVAAYEGGATMEQLARQEGVVRVTVKHALLRLGVELRDRPQWAPPDPEQLVRDHGAGASFETLAREHGVGAPTMPTALLRLGAELRDSSTANSRGAWNTRGPPGGLAAQGVNVRQEAVPGRVPRRD